MAEIARSEALAYIPPMSSRRLAFSVVSLVLLSLGEATLARADESDVTVPAGVAAPATDRPRDKKTDTAAPTSGPASSGACNGLPVYAPVYIEDWGRLAALTQSDPLVAPKAEFWAARREQANGVLGTGLILGGGAAALGTMDWLTTGELSRTVKWSMVGGVAVALVSFLADLAFAPDRDDLLTVINQWNLRHPDRLLAP